MKRSFFALAVAALATLAASSGCASSSGGANPGDEQDDKISDSDDPSNLLEGASAKLSDVITSADVDKDFGTAADKIPYPDTYWPFTDNGIDAQWNGSEKSPLEKYMGLVDPTKVAAAKNWENKNHGKAVPGVEDWFGHCPGWTGASMLNAPLKHAVSVKPTTHGNFATCTEGSSGCIKFDIGDINALMAEVHVDSDSKFIGGRCDTKPNKIKRDKFGRIDRSQGGGGCQGLNPGALMIVLGTQMKKNHAAMAIDAQSDFNTDQIWNQPAYQYHVYGFETLTAKDATKLVANGKTPPATYIWNTSAKGFAKVDIGIKWVSENGPNTEPVSGRDSTRETRFVAVLELDKDASNAAAKIIGGEYLIDENAGADRLTVPPFVWIAQGPGPETLATTVDGDSHNPFVKPSVVAKLVTLAQK